jgi:hypothetical protein
MEGFCEGLRFPKPACNEYLIKLIILAGQTATFCSYSTDSVFTIKARTPNEPCAKNVGRTLGMQEV